MYCLKKFDMIRVPSRDSKARTYLWTRLRLLPLDPVKIRHLHLKLDIQVTRPIAGASILWHTFTLDEKGIAVLDDSLARRTIDFDAPAV